MKKYQQTLQFLYDLQYSGIKLGLQNIHHLLTFLGNPQNRWPAVHIAGTNGKGSVAAFLHSILIQAGFRVGLYTSPHLIDFTERIRVDHTPISWEEIINLTRRLKPQIKKVKATFFEATSAIAFQHFAHKAVDIAVVETGLGGRLDATNAVKPLITVITNIGVDHTEFLGNNIVQIAREKAGIIKSGVPCITNNTRPEIVKVFHQACKEKKSPFKMLNTHLQTEIKETALHGSRFHLETEGQKLYDVNIPLAGFHQISNAALAVGTALNLKDFQIREQNIKLGLQNVVWRGRLQVVDETPLTLLDVAHNPDGFLQVLTFLKLQFPLQQIWTLVGLAKDKDYKKIADILRQYVERIGIITHFSDRGLPAEKMVEALKIDSRKVHQFKTVEEGFHQFRDQMNTSDILLITGSHYLAGELLQKLQIT